MAIIECPECKLKISDTAVSCPRCGYTKKPIKQKRNGFLVAMMVLQLFIILLLSGLLIVSYLNANTAEAANNDVVENEPGIFIYSSDNAYDPFALASENSILGENVFNILEGYAEGKDYTYESNDYFCLYTFTETIDYPVGEDAKLAIYTDVNSVAISMVEYSFRIDPDTSGFSGFYSSYKAIDAITEYYDVEPQITYVTDELRIESISRTQFENFMRKNYKSLYNITWDTDTLRIGLSIPNTNEYKKITCSVSFCIPSK